MGGRTYYDPEKAPDPQEWLSLDGHERVRLVTNYHLAARTKIRNMRAHAALHALVEERIAHGFGPICRTIDRLQKEGLTRHEAIHAVASVLAHSDHELVNKTGMWSAGDAQRELNARIEGLSASTWKGGDHQG